ncbi:MAG: hypothetical protein MK180_14025 [Rhodobacteraceae bacterium]|nr:hypothetical protein [Paracoccaceae bacterium]
MSFVGLEMHDATLWSPERVLPLLPIMERWGYNALVLHENDLLDEATQLGLTANYGVSDLRLKKVRNRAAWLGELATRLERFGARLFIEIKEPSFHDYALELYPELTGGVTADWPAFCRAKMVDLLARVPGLGGVILNISSPESRVSMPDEMAEGAALDRGAFFDDMIAAFKDPLHARGKDLWVRDFSYTADVQSDMLSAVARAGVGASVKITAHDYFPEYPENPVAQGVAGPMILEFDAFGEHTGWDVIPNCRVAEFARRMTRVREMGAAGILVRTSWEAIRGANAIDGSSAVNVYALPRLLAGPEAPEALVAGWLGRDQGVEEMIASAEIARASYWNACVFPRHSCLASSWQEAWLSMQSHGMGRRDRVVHVASDDPLLAQGEAVIARSEAAVELAKDLAAKVTGMGEVFAGFRFLPTFARQFQIAQDGTAKIAQGESAAAEAAQLEALADELEQIKGLPTRGRVLLDPAQARLFAGSLRGG